MTEQIFILGLIIHFLADFALQTKDQAEKKSISIAWLSHHVSVYSLIWLLVILPFGLVLACKFAFITFICHFVTDYCTSRLGKPFWEAGDYHTGFVVVGFDQILHYIQLYYTYTLLFG